MSTTLTLEKLRKLVTCDAVAIRGKALLEPAGGAGDKVFPPTHKVDDGRRDPGAKYAFEKRRITQREANSEGGVEVRSEVKDCVLLDSVQSQANRMEEALEALWLEGKIVLPVISVDMSKAAPDVGSVTSISAPHRIADALLRDSILPSEQVLFRQSSLGRSFTNASLRDAGPLFRVCPTCLGQR